jgi:hypothetical protein
VAWRHRIFVVVALGMVLLAACGEDHEGNASDTTELLGVEPRSSLLGDLLMDGVTANVRWAFYSVEPGRDDYVCGVVLLETDHSWEGQSGQVIDHPASCHPDYRTGVFLVQHDLVEVSAVSPSTDIPTDLHVGVASSIVAEAAIVLADGTRVAVRLDDSAFAVELPRQVAVDRVELTTSDGRRSVCYLDDPILPPGPFVC